MRQALVSNPVQGFTPDRIETATVLDTTGILAIRVSEAVTYHINNDTGNVATMPIGVTVIAQDVASLTFGLATTVEVME